MKTMVHQNWKQARRHGSRGSGVLVVLVLMGCMAVLIMANTSTLNTLKGELKRIDRQQQKKFGALPR